VDQLLGRSVDETMSFEVGDATIAYTFLPNNQVLDGRYIWGHH